MIRRLAFLSVAAWAACAVSPALAQPYPHKPIRLLVGFAAGGGVDKSARTVGQPLGESVGQTVVVD
ncbi:MAG TPA: ABC transporter substrate-binding protein, partial [Burkholderiales bacterium]|nr:ABC transporter substrate-binding protein [Burkholderiales bacterium]